MSEAPIATNPAVPAAAPAPEEPAPAVAPATETTTPAQAAPAAAAAAAAVEPAAKAKVRVQSSNPAYRDPVKPIIPNVPLAQGAKLPTARGVEPASAQPGAVPTGGSAPVKRKEMSRGLGSSFYGVYCKRCGDAEIVEDHREGDLVCGECGLTLQSRMIDDSSEWRSFSSSDHAGADPNRVGHATNTLLEADGTTLSTGIFQPGADGTTQRWSNARRVHTSRAERVMAASYPKISELTSSMSLPLTVEESAKLVFKRVAGVRSINSRGFEAVIAACVYIACRQQKLSRTLKEVCAHTRVNKREIGRVYKAILKTLGTNLSIITAKEYIPRFASILDLPFNAQRAAVHVAEKATDDRRVAGRSPISVAAAALYMVCSASEPSLQRDKAAIGKVCGVAEVTLSLAYRDMLPFAAELFPSSFYTPAIPLAALPTS